MKATIKLFKTDGETKKGYPVKLILSHKGKERKKTLNHSQGNDWNPNTELPLTSHHDFDSLYPEILEIRKRSHKSEFTKITDFDKAFNYAQNVEIIKVINFYKFAQEQIDYMNESGREGNADAYQCAINSIKSFQPKLQFDEIDSYLIERYKKFIVKGQIKKSISKDGVEITELKKIKNSTIRTYIAEIRAIYNICVRLYRVEDKKPFHGAFKSLPVPRRRVKNVYILSEGIRELENANIEYQSIQRSIDLTLLQFYFGGVDLIDIYYLKWKQIYGGRVFFERTKLGALKYEFDLKLFGQAKRIIDKIGVKDGEFVFPWRKDKVGYKTFRKNHNRDLQNAFNKLGITVLPKPDKFTSKCIRHTFATIAKFKFIDIDIIRELQGHERSDIDTMYKDKFPEVVRDQAHEKIII